MQEEQRFHIDSAQSKPTQHLVAHDPWYQAGFVLIAGVNSAYALGYSGIIMVPLGWIAGTLGLVAAALISLYASLLLARLHETGGKRHIRYRDLTGHVYGRKMYYVTWTLQYINLFMINIGYMILAGQSLKAIYTSYSNEAMWKLPYFIAITGIICSAFAFGIPHLSALRAWLGVSSILSLIYILIAIGLSARDGHDSPPRDYGIYGSKAHKMFSCIAAAANLVFVYNTGMLPEIQATLKSPSVKNMERALYLNFTVGLLPLWVVTLVGYWAYGSSTSAYLLNNAQGPEWIKTLANISAFLQTVITIHIFASPMYEYLDTEYGRSTESIYSVHNWTVRLVSRATYLIVTTCVAALFPFLGDFMILTGALSTFPLTFVLANHMYIKVKGNDLSLLQKSWHWANVWLFALLAVAGAVAAVRFIIIDYKTYHIFANL